MSGCLSSKSNCACFRHPPTLRRPSTDIGFNLRSGMLLKVVPHLSASYSSAWVYICTVLMIVLHCSDDFSCGHLSWSVHSGTLVPGLTLFRDRQVIWLIWGSYTNKQGHGSEKWNPGRESQKMLWGKYLSFSMTGECSCCRTDFNIQFWNDELKSCRSLCVVWEGPVNHIVLVCCEAFIDLIARSARFSWVGT